MPVHSQWYDDEKTIVLYTFEGHWTIQELVEDFRTADERLQPGEQPLYYIVDMTRNPAVPPGMLASRAIMEPYMRLDGGLTIVVGASRFVRMLGEAMIRLGLDVTMEFTDTIAEAEALITRHREVAISSKTSNSS